MDLFAVGGGTNSIPPRPADGDYIIWQNLYEICDSPPELVSRRVFWRDGSQVGSETRAPPSQQLTILQTVDGM